MASHTSAQTIPPSTTNDPTALGACISGAGTPSTNNVTQANCSSPSIWTVHPSNQGIPLGLCEPTDAISEPQANVPQSACPTSAGQWIQNGIPGIPEASNSAGGTINERRSTITEPSIRIPIPGLQFTSPSDILNDPENLQNEIGQRPLYIPYIAEYIKGIYRYGIILSGVIALLMIIIAGFQWAVSGGNSDSISAAKTRISHALTGLIIIMGAYTLLITINPALVNLVPLKIDPLATITFESEIISPFEQYATEEDTNNRDNVGTLNQKDLEKIPKLPNLQIKAPNPYVIPAMIPRLREVAEEMAQVYPSYVIRVGSAARDAREQYQMMVKYAGCPVENQLQQKDIQIKDWQKICDRITGRVAMVVTRVDGVLMAPKNVSHLGGNALDLQIINNGKIISPAVDCSKTTDPNVIVSAGLVNQHERGTCVPREQQELIGVMLKHGFCVALKEGGRSRESWHFELVEGKPDNIIVRDSFCVRAGTPYAIKEKLPYAFR